MEPVQIVRKYFAAFKDGKIQDVLRLLDDNVVWNVAGVPNVSTVGLIQGKERVREWMNNFPQNFQPLDFKIEEYFTTGNEVLVTGSFRHKIISTGRIAGSDLVIRFVVNGGLICKYQIYEDSAILSQAFDNEYAWGTTKQRINGNVYAFEDSHAGSGTPIVFTHGLFLNRSIFSHQVNALSDKHRCISIDMLGHGESDAPDQKWMLEDVADDLALFIKENHLAPVNYVGLSQGAMIGIRLAAKYPELVDKLILMGVSARQEYPERIQQWQSIRQSVLEESCEQLDDLFAMLQQRILPQQWIAEHPAEAKEEREVMLSNDRRGIALSIDAAVLNRTDVRALLPDIKAETLIICGELDMATPVELAKEIAEEIPKASLKIVPGVGHHAPLESPKLLSHLIENFIKY